MLRAPPDRPVLGVTVNVRDAVLLGGFDERAVGMLGGDADGGETVETGLPLRSTSGSRRRPPCASTASLARIVSSAELTLQPQQSHRLPTGENKPSILQLFSRRGLSPSPTGTQHEHHHQRSPSKPHDHAPFRAEFRPHAVGNRQESRQGDARYTEPPSGAVSVVIGLTAGVLKVGVTAADGETALPLPGSRSQADGSE